jgi:copper resistance protein D
MIGLDWVLTTTRFISFGASMLLAGIFGFYLLIVPTDSDRRRLWLLPGRLILLLEVIALVAQVAWLLELLDSFSEGAALTRFDTEREFLFGTQFGKIGLLRCGLLTLLAAYRIVRFSGWKPTIRPWIEAMLVLGQIALLAWFNHAAAAVGSLAAIQLCDDLLHLVASAIWPGGLIPLLLLLKNRRVPEIIKRMAVVRFSNVSVALAAIVGSTGILNGYFRLHDISLLVTTSYGRYVLLKAGCFLALIGLGALNRFKVIPRLTGSCSDISQPESWRELRRNILVEQLFFMVILVAVARLGLLAPPS